MRQALHIFKKDVRQLWFEIAIALIVTAAFAFIGARRGFWLDDPGANRSVAWSMVQLILPLAWWILIARVVYGEILPGDRQFWITRPYRWTSLLGAKLLFIGVFVNLPLLAADVIILRAYGFLPGEEIQGLVWKQILCTLVFLLPVAAVCAITTRICAVAVGGVSCCWWACWYGTSLYQGSRPALPGAYSTGSPSTTFFWWQLWRRSRF